MGAVVDRGGHAHLDLLAVRVGRGRVVTEDGALFDDRCVLRVGGHGHEGGLELVLDVEERLVLDVGIEFEVGVLISATVTT